MDKQEGISHSGCFSAVATASRLPTATRDSNNSYTTSWDTTARTDVRVMGQADCSFVFGLFLQELSLLALMESADPRLISSVGSWP